MRFLTRSKPEVGKPEDSAEPSKPRRALPLQEIALAMPGFGETDFAWLGSSLQSYKGSKLHGSQKALPGELFCEYAREYAASLS